MIMEIIIPIIIFLIFFIMFSICGYCCKRNKQGIVYGVANPHTVTTTTTYNTSNPPYPVMETPMPQPVTAPPAGFTHAPYPLATPYPPAQAYPPSSGGFSGNTPYPPMPMPGSGAYTAPVPPYPTHSAASQQPPSYAEAVTQPVTHEVYAKQSPYNPNYN